MEPEQNTSTPENTFPSAPAEASKNTLLVAGIAVVIIVAGLGWYMLQSVSTEVPVESTPLSPLTTETSGAMMAATTSLDASASTPDAATAALSTQGTSDELGAIDADLKATDLNSLSDINQI